MIAASQGQSAPRPDARCRATAATDTLTLESWPWTLVLHAARQPSEGHAPSIPSVHRPGACSSSRQLPSGSVVPGRVSTEFGNASARPMWTAGQPAVEAPCVLCLPTAADPVTACPAGARQGCASHRHPASQGSVGASARRAHWRASARLPATASAGAAHSACVRPVLPTLVAPLRRPRCHPR